DGEGGAGAAEGEVLVLAGRLGRDDLDDRGVHLEVIEVDGGHTVLAREEAGDLLVTHVAQADESLPELAPVHLLMAEGFLKLLRSDHVLLQQQFAELDRHVWSRNPYVVCRSEEHTSELQSR